MYLHHVSRCVPINSKNNTRVTADNKLILSIIFDCNDFHDEFFIFCIHFLLIIIMIHYYNIDFNLFAMLLGYSKWSNAVRYAELWTTSTTFPYTSNSPNTLIHILVFYNKLLYVALDFQLTYIAALSGWHLWWAQVLT